MVAAIATLVTEPGSRNSVLDFPRGTTLGRYIIVDRIGEGGMGVVFAAYDCGLERKVALKLVGNDHQSTRAHDRLLREARAIAKLAHPNVIAVHDVGTFEHRVFVAMELIDGGNLSAWLAEQPRSWRSIVEMFMQAGRGLAAAHAAGMIHRDFKPDNVLVGSDGRARVTDFGLARALDTEPSDPNRDMTVDLDTPVERTVVQAGTLPYMAPEQLVGGFVEARADQFSFSVALHEALYGERPFNGTTASELKAQIAAGDIRPEPAQTRVPRWLRAIVLRGLAASPSDRYASMNELLGAIARGPGARGQWIAATAACLVVAGGAWLAASHLVTPEARPSICSGASEKLRGIWDADRQRSIREAFVATGAPYAGDVWTTISARIDAYTRDWVGMRTDACEATHVRGEQSEALLDRRMQCLDQALTRTKALADLFARADRDVVKQAVNALTALPRIEHCADTERLTALVPLPDAPEARAKLDSIRTRLADAEALHAAEKPEVAAMSLALAKEAEAIGYRPLEAEALALAGVAMMAKDPKAAEDVLFKAVVAAQAGRDDRNAASALVRLAVSIGAKQNRPDDAKRIVDLATAAVERAGGDSELQCELANARGSIAVANGKFDEALTITRALLDKLDNQRTSDELPVLQARGMYASALIYTGDGEGASKELEAVLAKRIAAVGPEHPSLTGLLLNLGGALTMMGRFEQAAKHLQRATALLEQSYGPKHSDLILTRTTLSAVLTRVGRCDEGIAMQTRAVELAEQLYGLSHIEVADPLDQLAERFDYCQRDAESLPLAQRAVSIVDTDEHRASPELGIALGHLGNAQLETGQTQAARRTLERAITIEGVDPPNLSRAQFALARTLAKLGKQPARARMLAQEARNNIEMLGPLGKTDAERIDAWLASAR
ncbi:MAG: protein kinase [Kofleriaceae bacterium]